MADVVIAGAAGRMGCRLVALVQEEKATAVSSSEHSIFWPRPVRCRS